MKINRKAAILTLLASIAVASFTGCTTTRTQHGVTVEQSRSYNPFNWFR